MAQEAVGHLFDDKYRNWSPPTPTWESLLLHLQSEVNGIVINRSRLRRRRGDSAALDSAKAVLDPDMETDDVLDVEDWAYALLERLDDDGDACAILDLVLKGVEKPAQQAETLGWTRPRVYEARRRLKAAIRLVRYGQTS